MDAIVNVKTKEDFSGQAFSSYLLTDGSLVTKEKYNESTFQTASLNYFIKRHFGSFGGYLVKGVYFLLALLTCFVIITGVMVWLIAREKKMYEHKAKFNRNVGAIYLGACLVLYPAIALLFIVAKILPVDMESRFDLINYCFFGFWLAYTIYAAIIKKNYKIKKHALMLAGILGIVIPIINGLQTGLWFWKSLPNGYIDSFFIDVTWLSIGVITLVAALAAKPTVSRKQKRSCSLKSKSLN